MIKNTTTTSSELMKIQISSFASVCAAYPFQARSLLQASEVVNSVIPNNLNHLKPEFTKGFVSYYRGLPALLCLQPIYPLAVLGQKLMVSKLESKLDRKTVLAERMGCGFIIGLSTAVCCTPIELCVLARQKKLNVTDIVRKEGWTRPFRGGTLIGFHNGIFFAGLTSMYKHFENLYWEKTRDATSAAPMMYHGFLAAATTSLICQPLMSPIRLAMVMRNSPNYPNWSAKTCLKNAWAKHGIRAFWAGTPAGLVQGTLGLMFFHNLFDYLTPKI